MAHPHFYVSLTVPSSRIDYWISDTVAQDPPFHQLQEEDKWFWLAIGSSVTHDYGILTQEPNHAAEKIFNYLKISIYFNARKIRSENSSRGPTWIYVRLFITEKMILCISVTVKEISYTTRFGGWKISTPNQPIPSLIGSEI